MEIHDHLYALGLRQGREVFDDVGRFRRALDDPQVGPVAPGDLPLLVDAVRLGGLRSLVSMLDAGADVIGAVDQAGSALARDRGHPDVVGAQWACAVLGFAVGRVGDPDVRRYADRRPRGGTAEVTRVPGARPAPVPPQFAAAPPPAYGGPAWSAPVPPPKRRRAWPIVLAVAVVVALVAGVGGFFVVTRDDDGDETSESDGPTSSTTTSDGPTTESVDPDGTDFASVNARYSGLASLVTSGVDECAKAAVTSGETERLECPFGNGVLALVTYGSPSELEAGRRRQVTFEAGGVYDQTPQGTILGFEVNNAEGQPTEAFLYWDDNAAQSATYTAEPGADLDQLVTLHAATDPAVAYPTAPSDPALVDFVDQWFPISRCERVATIVADQVEESYCDVGGPVEVYIGTFDSRANFRFYRRDIARRSREDGRTEHTSWTQQAGQPAEGALYEYDNGEGYKALYWDQPDCLCYAEAFLRGGTHDRLFDWWER